MGTIPSRREDRGLTPLRLWAWISVSAAANACRKYAANSGTPEQNGFSAYFRVLALYPLLQMLQTLD